MAEQIDFNKTFEIITASFNRWAEQMAPIFNNIVAYMQDVYESIYQNYIDNGAVYGKTHEGMMRYLQEIGKAERLIREGQDILRRQEDIRDLKKQITIKRLTRK
jgi:hypothetical protein